MAAPVVPTAAQLEAILADLRKRMPMADACAGAEVPLADFRRGLMAGRKAKSGQWRDVHRSVVKAQVAGRRRALSLLDAQIEKGNPAAIAALLESLRQPDEAPEPAPTEPMAFLRWRLADVRRRMERTHGIAYNQLFKQEQELLKAIEDEETARSTRVRGGANRTPAQVLADETSHARELAEIHLQVYVIQYLARHPGLFLSSASGRIEIMAG